jgi:RimJ/RimL family protein N-acetyltransferase
MVLPSAIEAGAFELQRLTPAWASGFAEACRRTEEALRAWMPSAAAEQSQATTFVAASMDAFDRGTSFAYAMVENSEVVGYCNLTPHEERAEIGYWVRSDLTRAGLATSAIRALVGAAFEAIPGLKSVEAHCDEANVASRRAAERAGLHVVDSIRRKPRTAEQTEVELVLAIERRQGLPRPGA